MIEDPIRLRAVRQSGLLDGPPEESFDRLTRLAAKALRAPVALISLVDRDRQFFKSCVGLPEPWASRRQTPLTHSFCQHVAGSGEPLVIEDARQCPLVRENPAVAELGVIAYAGVPLTTAEGAVLGSFCVIDDKPRRWSDDDVDVLRELATSVMTEIGLRQARDAARAASRAKDLFLAALSHELRTPVSPVLMIATSMGADESLPEGVREDARTIQRNIELQTRRTDDLLDVTRIENGKRTFDPHRVDLDSLLRDCVELCATDARAKGVRFDYAGPELATAVSADPARLKQVFCNLLKNAIKFTPAPNVVAVRSAGMAGASDAEGPWVRVTVADTGIGASPQVLATMFDPYAQGHRAVTGAGSGLGLGLAISKGIVEAHGGRISAASEGPGRGTTLTVELPALAPADVAGPGLKGSESAPFTPAAPVARAIPAAPPRLEILLVDDHEDTLNAMTRLLRKLHHQVTPAGSKASALAAAATARAASRRFDLLISDIGLADGSGLELMRDLLAGGPIRGIALTGYGSASDIEESTRAGFAAHLTKPIKFSELEEAIRRLSV